MHQGAWAMMRCPTALGGQVGAQVAVLSGRSCIRPGSGRDLEVEVDSVVLRESGASRWSALSRPKPRPDVPTRPQCPFPQARADLRYSITVAQEPNRERVYRPWLCQPAHFIDEETEAERGQMIFPGQAGTGMSGFLFSVLLWSVCWLRTPMGTKPAAALWGQQERRGRQGDHS